MKKIAINGMGNTGCSILLKLCNEYIKNGCIDNSRYCIVAVRDPYKPLELIVEEINKGFYGEFFDSSFRLEFTSFQDQPYLLIGDLKIIFLNSEKTEWSRYNIDFVIEASGAFLSKSEITREHNFETNVNHNENFTIALTALSSSEDSIKTLINNINFDSSHINNYSSKLDQVIDNGSCTTRAIAPIMLAIQNLDLPVNKLEIDVVHPLTREKRIKFLNSLINNTLKLDEFSFKRRGTSVANGLIKIFPWLCGKVFTTSCEIPIPDISRAIISVVFEKCFDLDSFIKELKVLHNKGILNITENYNYSVIIPDSSYYSFIELQKVIKTGEYGCKIELYFDNRMSAANAVLQLVA